MNVPRVLVAGLKGGSGKTLISLGLVAAWRKKDRNVAPFKKGPDYIDPAWLSLAANRRCRNLDQFIMGPDTVRRAFQSGTIDADIALIEGNRGLYDGVDSRGSYSTAELAKLLRVPVVLVVDCSKATRTVAAEVLGCITLDPDVTFGGVILNRTAGTRHETVVRDAIERDCRLDVVGTLRRSSQEIFPERHLGLVPPQEHGRLMTTILRATRIVEQGLDLEAIWQIANRTREIPPLVIPPTESATATTRIGVFRDAAFSFYYPENIEALQTHGARVIEISPMRDDELPPLDGLYIGGGFPETLAPALCGNKGFRESVRHAIEAGLPTYAECGGAVYLGDTLTYKGATYQMAGALPVDFAFEASPRGHGYIELEAVEENPFYAPGETIRGHEFHYTYMRSSSATELTFAFRVLRGHGFDGHKDGMCRYNLLASYAHVHALGTPTWAPALVAASQRHRESVESAVQS